MVLWLRKADRKNKKDLGKVRFFYSYDLKNWEFLSDFDQVGFMNAWIWLNSLWMETQNKKWLIRC